MNDRDGKKKGQLYEIIGQLSMLTQLGLTLIIPVLLCLFICWFLQQKAGVGAWIYIPGFFFGLGGSGMSAWKFYLMTEKEREKKDKGKKKGISFNSHE